MRSFTESCIRHSFGLVLCHLLGLRPFIRPFIGSCIKPFIRSINGYSLGLILGNLVGLVLHH